MKLSSHSSDFPYFSSLDGIQIQSQSQTQNGQSQSQSQSQSQGSIEGCNPPCQNGHCNLNKECVCEGKWSGPACDECKKRANYSLCLCSSACRRFLFLCFHQKRSGCISIFSKKKETKKKCSGVLLWNMKVNIASAFSKYLYKKLEKSYDRYRQVYFDL